LGIEIGAVQHHSPDEVDQFREAILKVAHELAEALTAADAYLAARFSNANSPPVSAVWMKR
jgi:hypothetical protein